MTTVSSLGRDGGWLRDDDSLLPWHEKCQQTNKYKLLEITVCVEILFTPGDRLDYNDDDYCFPYSFSIARN